MGQQGSQCKAWESLGPWPTLTHKSSMSAFENTPGNILLELGIFPDSGRFSGEPNLELSFQLSLVLPGAFLILGLCREMAQAWLFRGGKSGTMCVSFRKSLGTKSVKDPSYGPQKF